MHRRINITLPEETVRLIEQVSKKGDRSRFIDTAVKHYVGEVSRSNLRKRLKERYIHSSDRDLRVAEEWFPLEEESWEKK